MLVRYGHDMGKNPFVITLLILFLLPVIAGCGSSSNSSATPTTASGDIPDTATYLTYQGSSFSVKYVEGWSIQTGPGSVVTIGDKDSSETVAVSRSDGRALAAFAGADLAQLAKTAPRFRLLVRRTVRLQPGQATLSLIPI